MTTHASRRLETEKTEKKEKKGSSGGNRTDVLREQESYMSRGRDTSREGEQLSGEESSDKSKSDVLKNMDDYVPGRGNSSEVGYKEEKGEIDSNKEEKGEVDSSKGEKEKEDDQENNRRTALLWIADLAQRSSKAMTEVAGSDEKAIGIQGDSSMSASNSPQNYGQGYSNNKELKDAHKQKEELEKEKTKLNEDAKKDNGDGLKSQLHDLEEKEQADASKGKLNRKSGSETNVNEVPEGGNIL